MAGRQKTRATQGPATQGPATVSFSGTVKTDPVPVPGALDAKAVIDNSVLSPDNLIMVKGTIRKSDNYKVPCLHLIAGSW